MSQRWGSAQAQPGYEDPKGPGSGSSPQPWWLPWHPGFYPTHLGTVSAHPGRGYSYCAGFASSGHSEEVAHTLQSHMTTAEMDAQRVVRVGGQQRQADQAIDGGLHLGGIILTSLGVLG